jgi:hypothetical protein
VLLVVGAPALHDPKTYERNTSAWSHTKSSLIHGQNKSVSMAENMPCYASQRSDCNVGGILTRDLYQFASFQLRDYNNRNETTILLFSLFITSLKILYQSPPLRAVELTKHKTNPLSQNRTA